MQEPHMQTKTALKKKTFRMGYSVISHIHMQILL